MDVRRDSSLRWRAPGARGACSAARAGSSLHGIFSYPSLCNRCWADHSESRVNKDSAARIDQLTHEASQLLDNSIQAVRGRCSEKAAGVYRSSIGRVMGEMSAGLLFPLWREHPDLEPAAMREPGTYNAREFQMPADVADEALAALARARQMMDEVAKLVAAESDPAQRQPYAAELDGVLAALDAAIRGVEKRKEDS
jgi:hypothetical protein